jgi:hypothetical protein
VWTFGKFQIADRHSSGPNVCKTRHSLRKGLQSDPALGSAKTDRLPASPTSAPIEMPNRSWRSAARNMSFALGLLFFWLIDGLKHSPVRVASRSQVAKIIN